MKIYCAILLFLTSLGGLAACDTIVPPDRAPENSLVTPDDFAWDKIDIVKQYDFIGVERIDCPKIQSALTGYGKCLPIKLPMGGGIACPLASPGKLLQFACLSIDDVPAVYTRIEFDNSAKNLDFSKDFGACKPAFDGPSANKKARYETDPGYKVCLFDKIAPYSLLRGENKALRPSGIYLDLSQNEIAPELIEKRSSVQVFDAPAALVMDARLLNPEERKQAFADVFLLFGFYRSFAPKTTQEPIPASK